VKSLAVNRHLEQLYLVGNPCTQFDNYREYVLNALPQLGELDGTKVTRTERILAAQRREEIDRQIERDSIAATKKEAARVAKMQAKKDKKPGFDGSWYCDTQVRSDLRSPASPASPFRACRK
jgi:protein TilB